MYRLVIVICRYHRDENGEEKRSNENGFRGRSRDAFRGLLGCDVSVVMGVELDELNLCIKVDDKLKKKPKNFFTNNTWLEVSNLGSSVSKSTINQFL